MAERYSQEEKQYFETVAQEAAEKARPHVGKDAEIDKIIKEVADKYEVHEDLMLRFQREVKRRLEEMWGTAKSEQEKRVVEEFGSYVKVVDGQYQPTGVSEKFTMRVRPGINLSWRDHFKNVGYIWDGVFGKSVDSGEFHKVIEETEKAREELESEKRNLELIKAAQKSTKELLALGASGFMARFRGKKGGLFASMAGGIDDIWEGRKENEDLVVDMKSTNKLIKSAGKKLERQETLRDTILEKVESLREDSRALFEKTFQKEISTLLAQKDSMKPGEFETQKTALKKKVDLWMKRTGFMHMGTFFNEAFGDVPGAKESLSDLEIKKREMLVARFYKNITGSNPPKGDVGKIVGILEEKNRETLKLIYDGKYPKKATELLQLLFSGETGKIALKPKERAIKPAVDVIANYLAYGREYAMVSDSDLDLVMKEFAENWRGVNAKDFDEVFDLILEGKKKPLPEEARGEKWRKEQEEKRIRNKVEKKKRKEIDKKAKEESEKRELEPVSNFWESITGEKPSEKDMKSLLEELKKDPEIGTRYTKLLKSKAKMNFMRVYFRGFMSDEKRSLVQNEERLVELSVDNFMKVLRTVDSIFSHGGTINESVFAHVIDRFLKDPKHAKKSMESLDCDTFLNYLSKKP